MLNKILKLIKILTKAHQKKLLLLQILVIISAVLEVTTILLFGPFLAFIGNNGDPSSFPYLLNAVTFFGINSEKDLFIYMSIFLLIIVLLSSLFSIITIRKLSFFAANVGSEFGDRLYSFYMSKSYLYHSNTNSAEIIKKIATEVNRVTDNLLQPIVQINARIATVVFLSIFILIYNTVVAVAGIIIISITYYTLFRVVKNRLSVNGEQISVASKLRFKLLNEGLNAIKEIQILGREHFFINKFNMSGKQFANSYGSNNSMYNIPKYVIELMLYVSILLLILYFVLKDTGELSTFLPTLAVFGIASFKLLPSFQQIYSGVAQIRSNISAFDSIYSDLHTSVDIGNNFYSRNSERISGSITLNNAFFKYSNESEFSLNDINIIIPFRSKIGIVGPSGSGKSTLIDILMGSINLSSGTLAVGGIPINKESVLKFRNNIGYVSQTPLILDGTIAENIAFGVDLEDINYNRLVKSAEIAQLTSWIESLQDSFHTHVGERGVKISGGQRQRIAIARAFYNDAEYIFFDEATSSLDTITENSIMETIEKISELKTIIMIAHRLSTVKSCDNIYIVTEGKIKDQGSFKYLLEHNKDFLTMSGV